MRRLVEWEGDKYCVRHTVYSQESGIFAIYNVNVAGDP